MTHRTTSPLAAFARLGLLGTALFLTAADGDACVINIDTGGDRDDDDGDDGDDDGECPDRERLCPGLVCDRGFATDDDGCELCECASRVCDPSQAGPPPECVGAFFDERSCSWSCGGGGCRSDGECGFGAVCRDGQCFVAPGCFNDAECGPGFFCDFSGGGAAPPPPDGGGGEDAPVFAAGVCAPVPGCLSDADCGPGRRCAFPDSTNALVIANAGVCVDDQTRCLVDDECRPGERCQLGCVGSCPQCDDCVEVVGTCGVVSVPCRDNTQCRGNEICQLGDPAARPCRDADGDGRCDDTTDPVPPPPEGVCIPAPGCFSDRECAPGQACILPGCECPAVCIDDGNGGCLPCACPEPQAGVCADVGVPCTADDQCARNEFCDLAHALPPPPPPCDPGTDCGTPDVLPAGVCRLRAPCDGVVCDDLSVCVVTADGLGTCVANTCTTVRCAADTHCEVQPDGSASCVPNPGECTSDLDCERGLVCNAGIDVCVADPSCRPEGPCVDVCFGYCVPPT
jgi:hypothetical protein